MYLDNLCSSIQEYRYLRYLSLSLTVPILHADVLSLSSNTNEVNSSSLPLPNPFKSFATALHTLVRNIRSEYMHTIFLRIAPGLQLTQSTSHGVTGDFVYRSKRSRAIHLLFCPIAFEHYSLRNLALLHVHGRENALVHDAKWWADGIRQRMGSVPHEIRVDVDYCECAREFIVVQPTRLIVAAS